MSSMQRQITPQKVNLKDTREDEEAPREPLVLPVSIQHPSVGTSPLVNRSPKFRSRSCLSKVRPWDPINWGQRGRRR